MTIEAVSSWVGQASTIYEERVSMKINKYLNPGTMHFYLCKFHFPIISEGASLGTNSFQDSPPRL